MMTGLEAMLLVIAGTIISLLGVGYLAPVESVSRRYELTSASSAHPLPEQVSGVRQKGRASVLVVQPLRRKRL
jgi:hypothetical protein